MLEEIIGFFFRFVFAMLFAWTGEILLFLITLGKHKPKWDLYAKNPATRFALFSEISLWLGAAFWVAVVLVVYSFMKGN